MAVGALKYIGNIGKSVTYSTADEIKKLNPVIEEFASQNADLGRTLYESAKDIKGTTAVLKKMAIESKVGEFATEYKKAFFEDLKSGNFYNRERDDQMKMRASGSLLDFDMGDPFAELDDSSFDDIDKMLNDDDDIFLADQMDRVGQKTANAIAEATGRSAEYVVRANAEGLRASQKHNTLLNNRVITGMAALNSSIATLVEFNTKVQKVHVDNSTKFYETETNLSKERNELLKKILENQMKTNTTVPNRNRTKEVTFSDIIGAEGTPNLKEYGKRISQNLKNMDGGISGMLDVFGEGNMLLAFAGSPLKFITDGIAKSIIPKAAKSIMTGFNKTISNLFGSAMAKLNTMDKDNDENSLFGIIKKIFGINTGYRSKFDTSKYNKGPIPFDGVTKMAITQVIPTHLAKIESALTNNMERIFDYNSGKFIDTERLNKEFKEQTQNNANRASAEIREEFAKYMKQIHLTKQTQDNFEVDLEKVLKKVYTDGRLLTMKGTSSSDWDIDERSYAIIKSILPKIDKTIRMEHNTKIFNTRDAQRRQLESEMADPTSLYRYIHNNSNLGEYVYKKRAKVGNKDVEEYMDDEDIKNTKRGSRNARYRGGVGSSNIITAIDKKGNNVLDYLYNISTNINTIGKEVLSGRISGGGSSMIGPPSPSTASMIDIGVRERKSFSDAVREANIGEDDRYENRIDKLRYKLDPNYRMLANYKIKIDKKNRKNRTRIKQGVKANVDMNHYFFEDPYMEYEAFEKELTKKVSAQHKEFERLKELKAYKENEESTKNKLLDKLLGTKAHSGIKKFVLGIDEFAQAPLKTVAKILNKTDERLFEIIYGDEENEEIGEDGELKTDKPKSILGQLSFNIKHTFSYLMESIKEDILLPLTDYLKGDVLDGAKTAFKNLLGYFGVDTDEIRERVQGSTKNFLGDAFRRPYQYAKDQMKRAYTPVKLAIDGTPLQDNYDIYEGKFSSTERNKQRKNKFDALVGFSGNNSLSNMMRKYFNGKSDRAAGIRANTREATEDGKTEVLKLLAKGKSPSEIIDMGYYNDIMSLDPSEIEGQISSFSKGSRMIKKTGLAVLSEGEMVIPSEMNPFYRKPTSKPLEAAKESAVKNRFINSIHKKLKGFNDGADTIYVDNDGFASRNNDGFIDKGYYDNYYYDDMEMSHNGHTLYGQRVRRRKHRKEEYEEGEEPLIHRMNSTASSGMSKLLKRLGFGKNKRKDPSKQLEELKSNDELLNGMLQDVTGDFQKYLPETFGGAIIGGGLSLITGAIGGPLLGAAVGAASSLVIQSDKVRDWLFGEMVKDADGNDMRSGNIISAELSNNIRKYLPDMAGGATVGAITSIMPFVPGGPVAGIILGSAIGFAKNNDRVQEMLFGTMGLDGERRNDGLFKQEFLKNLEQRVPEMAVGGAIGGVGGILFGGPFGLIGNIALGSSIGFMSQTQKFQEAIFGKYNEETDEYEGGLLGTVKDKVITPLISSLKPITKEIQLGFKKVFNTVQNLISSIFNEDLRLPIVNHIINTFKGPAKIITNAAKLMLKPATSVFTAPFRAIGAVGDHLRRKHIAGGNATYMTAEERLAYRDEYAEKQNNKIFKNPFTRTKIKHDKFNEFDNLLVDNDTKDLKVIRESLGLLQNPTKEADAIRNSASSRIKSILANQAGFDFDDQKNILKYLRKGDTKSVFNMINNADMGLDERQRLNLMVSKYYADYKTADDIQGASREERKKLYGELHSKGIKGISDKNIDKYINLTENEISLREKNKTPEEWINEKENERHKDIVNLFKDAISHLKILADPNSDDAKRAKQEMLNRNLSDAKRKMSVSKLFNRGDSNLFGDYEFATDSDGNFTRFKRNLDGSINEESRQIIDPETFKPIDVEGNPINGEASGYGVTDEDVTLNTFGKRALKATGRGLNKLWNFSAGNVIGKSIHDRRNSKISKKLDEELRDRNDIGDEDESRGNITYRYDMFGNPIKWVKQKGSDRWEVDESDAENKAYRENNPFNKFSNGFSRGINRIASIIKGEEDPEDAATRKSRKAAEKEAKKKRKEEKQGGIFGNIKRFVVSPIVSAISLPLKMIGGVAGFVGKMFGITKSDGTLKKGAKLALGGFGILTAASMMNVMEKWWDDKASPAIVKFWDDKVYPKIGKYIEPIRPAIAKAAVGMDKVINAIPTAIERLGNRIKDFIQIDLPMMWTKSILPFYKGGVDWLGDKVGKGIEFVVSALPTILVNSIKGAYRGLRAIFTSDIYTLFGGVGRPKSYLTGGNSLVTKKTRRTETNARDNDYFRAAYSKLFKSNANTDAALSPSKTSDNALFSYYSDDSSETHPRESYFTTLSDSVARTSRISNGAESSYSDSSYTDYSNILEQEFSNMGINNIDFDRELQQNNEFLDDSEKLTTVIGQQPKKKSLLQKITSVFSSNKKTQTSTESYIGTTYNSGMEYTGIDDGKERSYDDLYKGGLPNSMNHNNADTLDNYISENDLPDDVKDIIKKLPYIVDGEGTVYADMGDGMVINTKTQEQVSIKSLSNTKYTKPKNILSVYSEMGLRAILTQRSPWLVNKLAGSNIQIAGKFKAAKLGYNTVVSYPNKVVQSLSGTIPAADNVFHKAAAFFKKWFVKDKNTTKAIANMVVENGGNISNMSGLKDSMAERMVKEVEKGLSSVDKVAGKTGKAGAKAASSGLLKSALVITNLAFIAIDFISGYNNAANYFGMLDKDTPAWMKTVSGLVKVVNGYLTFGLLPMEWIAKMVQTVIELFMPKTADMLREYQNTADSVLLRHNEFVNKHGVGNRYDDIKAYNKGVKKNTTDKAIQLAMLNEEANFDRLYEDMIADRVIFEKKNKNDKVTMRDIFTGMVGADYYTGYTNSTIAENNRLFEEQYNAQRDSKFRTPQEYGYEGAEEIEDFTAQGSRLPLSVYSGGSSELNKDQLADQILGFLSKHESSGNYGAINANDSGSMSIGMYQYNARYNSNALRMLDEIQQRDPDSAKSILGDSLYNKFFAPNREEYHLAGYIPEGDEINKISNFISSEHGISAQNYLIKDRVQGYIDSAIKAGITDPGMILYYADTAHRSGISASSAVKNVVGDLTLDSLKSSIESNRRGLLAHTTRNNELYESAKVLSSGGTLNLGSNFSGQFGAYSDTFNPDDHAYDENESWYTALSRNLTNMFQSFFGIFQPTKRVEEETYGEEGDVAWGDQLVDANFDDDMTIVERAYKSYSENNSYKFSGAEIKAATNIARLLLYETYGVSSDAELGYIARQLGISRPYDKANNALSMLGAEIVDKYARMILKSGEGLFDDGDIRILGTTIEEILGWDMSKSYSVDRKTKTDEAIREIVGNLKTPISQRYKDTVLMKTLTDKHKGVGGNNFERAILSTLIDNIGSTPTTTPVKMFRDNTGTGAFAYKYLSQYGIKDQSFKDFNNLYIDAWMRSSTKADKAITDAGKMIENNRKNLIAGKEVSKRDNKILEQTIDVAKYILSRRGVSDDKADYYINTMYEYDNMRSKAIDDIIKDTKDKGTLNTAIIDSDLIKLGFDPIDIYNDPYVKREIARAIRTTTQTSPQVTNRTDMIKNSFVLKKDPATGKDIPFNVLANPLSGRGSMVNPFISQLDPRYANNMVGNETIAQSGCGPAVASMAIAGMSANGSLMDTATGLANRYKDGGGVNASYFKDIFSRAGANTSYYTGNDKKSQIESSLARGQQVVLMGRDSGNRSKENSPFGPGNHYVLAKGMSGNKILINDPELSGPKVYDKSILNKTKLGVAVSARGSKGNEKGKAIGELFKAIGDMSSALLGGYKTNEDSSITELGDYGLNPSQQLSGTIGSTPIGVNQSVIDSIVNFARSYVGKLRYSQENRESVYSGGSYADCSSFVSHIYRKHGISVGTYTAAMLNNGIRINNINQLIAGDIVLFRNTTSGDSNKGYPEGVSHAAIYIGNDTIVQMSSYYNMVTEVKLSTSSHVQKGRFLCGRRVISQTDTMKNTTIIASEATTNTASKVSLDKRPNYDVNMPQARGSGINNRSSVNTSGNFEKFNISAKGSETNTSQTNKLLNTIVGLLTKMAGDTGSIKEIVNLLTQVMGGTKTTSSNVNALEVLNRHNKSDNIDMNSLINDLNEVLKV